MPYTQVANLDYNDIKLALKEYLRSQSDFTDYDFEGSVWSTLLDVLAYNTYYTAFNTNLVVNELFLDSATLRDNVVGIAKQLGYTPKSVTSPVAYISFDVNFSNTTPDTAILRTGSAFTTIFDSELYQYTTLDDVSAPVENGTATFINVPIYEGSLVKNSYTVNTALKSQRFIIQNQGVDTSSLRVKVYPSQNSSAFEFYDRAENILDVNSTTKSYFLNEIEDENYELFFGDGVLGKKLETGQFIEVSYLVTNGPSTNGAKTFVFNGIVDDKDNAVYPLTVSVNSVTAASGGENIESIEKIKFNAPRYFGTQDRAVTPQDYAAIVRNVYPAVADIITFGGETADPPEYGKVKIVIKPSNASLLSSFTKQDIIRKLNTPGAFDSFYLGNKVARIIGISVDESCPIINTPLRMLPGIFSGLDVKILSIFRKNELITPSGKMEIYPGDDIYICIRNNDLLRALRVFGIKFQENRKIIILGAGNIGLNIIKLLESDYPDISCKIIDNNINTTKKIANNLSNQNTILCGDALDIKLLKEAGAEDAEAIISVTDDDEVNIFGSILAKDLGCKRSMAIVSNHNYRNLNKRLNLDIMVNPGNITTSAVLQYVRRGKVKEIHDFGNDRGEIMEIEILPTTKFADQKISDLTIPEGVVIGGIVRNEELIFPDENTIIYVKDKLIIFSDPSSIKEIEKYSEVNIEFF